MSRMLLAAFFGVAALSAPAFAFVGFEPKVIYGTDDRSDVYDVADAGLRDVAESTAAMISLAKMVSNGRGGVNFPASTYGEQFGLCKDEPFYSQPSAAMCSAFLVGDDLLATAGHCIQASDCANNVFVFGYKMNGANSPPTDLPAGDVYRCKEVVARELTGNQDYSLVRLDRKVTGRRALRLSTAPVAVGDAITVIGHPSGLPTKIAGGANVRSLQKGFFMANLDTYGGNSGSAVFNTKTLEVVGILVRGERDFAYDSSGSCSRSNRCENGACRGEDVTNISYIINALPH